MQAALHTFEQLKSKGALRVLQDFARRGLRDSEQRCGLADGACLLDGMKHFDMAKPHFEPTGSRMDIT
jgi:hypothetical protein